MALLSEKERLRKARRVGERLERDEKKGGKFLNKATLHSELIMLAVLS